MRERMKILRKHVWSPCTCKQCASLGHILCVAWSVLQKWLFCFSYLPRLFCAPQSFPFLPPEVWPPPHPIPSHLWHEPDKHQRCQVPNGWQANPSSPHGSPLKQALSSFSALRQGEWRWGHGYISYMLSTNCRQMLTVKVHLSVNVKNLQQIDTIMKLSNYAIYIQIC